MSKNYFIIAFLLIVISLPFLKNLPPGDVKSRGVVFYNAYESAYLIASFKSNETIWIKPANLDAVLIAYEGQNITFNRSQLSTAGSSRISGFPLYSAVIKDIQLQEYALHNFIIVWVQIVISLLAFIIAILLWRRFLLAYKKVDRDGIESVNNPLKQDWGIFFFGAALILWAMTAVIAIYASKTPASLACVSMLSISNNFLFALSFPFFKHNIPFFNQNRFRYVLIFSAGYILTLLMSAYGFCFSAPGLGDMAELYFTVITFAVLAYLLNESFTRRDSPGTGLVALCCTTIAIFAQIFQMSPGLSVLLGDWANVLYLGSFSMVVLLYVTLVYSWYTEEVEIRLQQENDIENWAQKLVDADKTDTKTVYQCVLELRARTRIRKPIHILREKYSDHPDFVDTLVGLEGRLSALKKQKNGNTEDAKNLEVSFNKLCDDFMTAVKDFLYGLPKSARKNNITA